MEIGPYAACHQLADSVRLLDARAFAFSCFLEQAVMPARSETISCYMISQQFQKNNEYSSELL